MTRTANTARIHRNASICLRHRRLYKAAKQAGLVQDWIDLVTAKLMWLHVEELRRDQSAKLTAAAAERDRLLARQHVPKPMAPHMVGLVERFEVPTVRIEVR